MTLNKVKGIQYFFVSSCLLSLAMYYPQQLGFFIFFFLVPILYYFFFKIEYGDTFGAVLKMFFFSFMFVTVSTSWFLSSFPLDWLRISDPVLSFLIVIPLWLSFSFVFSLSIALWPMFIFSDRKLSPTLYAFLGSCVWVVLEYFRSWLIAFAVYGNETIFGPHHTYYSIAYPLASFPFFRDLFSVGGIYLATFLVILCNYFIFYICFDRVKIKDIKFLALLVFLFVFVSSFTMSRIRGLDKSEGNFIATVVGMEEPSSTDKDIESKRVTKSKLFISEMSNPDGIIIFPENINILPLFSTSTSLENENYKKIRLAVGSFTGKEFYNMYFFSPVNNQTSYYRKQLLMPIGEYNVKGISFLLNVINNERWLESFNSISHTSKMSKQILPFEYTSINGLVLGGSLCSENISPYIYRDSTRAGATVLLNLASHAPFHGSKLLERQTLAINTVRAVENGRYLITASNYGKSFVINDKGEVKYISPEKARDSISNVKIEIKKYRTPYVRYGDYIVYFSVIIIWLCYLWLPKNKLYS